MIQNINHNHSAVNALQQKLVDKVPEIRAKAAEVLGEIVRPGNSIMIKTFIYYLERETDNNVQLNLIHSLGKISDASIIPQIVSFLNSNEPDIRTAIVEVLGKIGNQETVGYLLESVGDESPIVRATTVKALGEIGGEDAIPALVNACSDKDDTVRLNAVEAIGKIGSRNASN